MSTQTVIGPIDAPTWYCMRQCRECITYLSSLHDDKYTMEINAEKDMLKHFMNGVLGRA